MSEMPLEEAPALAALTHQAAARARWCTYIAATYRPGSTFG
jgi:hypothetical protein